MRLLVEKRFLRVPVKYDGKPFRFSLTGEDIAPYWFFAVYEKDAPDAVYWADLRNYLGRTVELDAPEGFEAVFSEKMEPLTEKETALRPALHFTAERGWINDPNGFSFYNGKSGQAAAVSVIGFVILCICSSIYMILSLRAEKEEQ